MQWRTSDISFNCEYNYGTRRSSSYFMIQGIHDTVILYHEIGRRRKSLYYYFLLRTLYSRF